MAEPPGTKSGSRLPLLYCEKPQTFREHLFLFAIVGEDACLRLSAVAWRTVFRQELIAELFDEES